MEPGADPTTPPSDWRRPERGQPLSIPPVAFVFGATGYVGSAVVEELVRSGAERVVAHVRPGSRSEAHTRERFARTAPRARLESRALEADTLGDLLDAVGPTHAFLCHGTTKKRAAAEKIADPYETVDVGLTRLVCDALRRVEDAPRVVYLSSMGANENARSAYLAARGRAEKAVRTSGLPYTICRAPLISGPDRIETRTGETLARRVLDPIASGLGALGFSRLAGRWTSMDAEEVAEGLVRCAFHYQTIGRVVLSDELRSVGVYERESWTPRSRRDTARH